MIFLYLCSEVSENHREQQGGVNMCGLLHTFNSYRWGLIFEAKLLYKASKLYCYILGPRNKNTIEPRKYHNAQQL